MFLKEFVKELNGNRVEGELIKTILYSLLTSFIILEILYFLKLRYIENFMPKYGFYLFFAVLSYALIMPSVRQVRAYKEFACMTGMMIGMTIGVIAGFVAGFFIASTNGMFYGSVFGISAGFMGGLMGAMTAIMMINDNLKAASVVVFLISSVVLIGLNYMIYFEMKNSERRIKEDNFPTIIISFVLTTITTWLMVFGPRSALFQ